MRTKKVNRKKAGQTKRKVPTFDELAGRRLETPQNQDLHRELEMATRDESRKSPNVDLTARRKRHRKGDEKSGYA